LLEVNDVTAPATVYKAGTVIGTIPSAPTKVQIQLSSTAARAIMNNRETQFRLVLRSEDGTFFTNRDDAYVGVVKPVGQ
jgi:hypothetical protein